MLIATGSEVALAMQAQDRLAQAGVPVRVVSMPSTTVFDRQDAAYKSAVLPEGLPQASIIAVLALALRHGAGLDLLR